MGPWLPGLLAHTPEAVKRLALVQLFGATAAAFERETPALRGLSREECLREYARFTADHAGEALGEGSDLAVLRARLYDNACRLGRMPGRLLHVCRVDDVMTLGRFLYSVLDIDLDGSASGDITIGRCYFSSYYSPEVCRLMSAMDRGLFAGLAGGGELVFSQRITEGATCCRARFEVRPHSVDCQEQTG